ncbi:nucleotide-binding domain containing protein [Phyllobacterium sp. SB3]|uniref:nucleotide-binding domain containing protein n=1 Tax=Phyllobacterium sp. SB3 TaxID=3156073 RepID=UPI0032AE8A9B
MPIICSTTEPQARFEGTHAFRPRGRNCQDRAIFAGIADNLANTGTKRLVVGGSETLGAIVEALKIASMQVGLEIDPGVALALPSRNSSLTRSNRHFPDTETAILRSLSLRKCDMGNVSE